MLVVGSVPASLVRYLMMAAASSVLMSTFFQIVFSANTRTSFALRTKDCPIILSTNPKVVKLVVLSSQTR